MWIQGVSRPSLRRAGVERSPRIEIVVKFHAPANIISGAPSPSSPGAYTIRDHRIHWNNLEYALPIEYLNNILMFIYR